jgi:hypothetical protein
MFVICLVDKLIDGCPVLLSMWQLGGPFRKTISPLTCFSRNLVEEGRLLDLWGIFMAALGKGGVLT